MCRILYILISDPCVYVKWDGDKILIIAIWVDDLLLFTSTDKLMTKIKNYIKSVWEATNIGEPNKIVGIEITMNENSVSISQQKYIENILRQEHMFNANPVGIGLHTVTVYTALRYPYIWCRIPSRQG